MAVATDRASGPQESKDVQASQDFRPVRRAEEDGRGRLAQGACRVPHGRWLHPHEVGVGVRPRCEHRYPQGRTRPRPDCHRSRALLRRSHRHHRERRWPRAERPDAEGYAAELILAM